VNCDKIFVLGAGGKILEQGNHWSLLSNPNGVYSRMWHQQQMETQQQKQESIKSNVNANVNVAATKK